MNAKTIIKLIRDTFKNWNEDKAPRLAAALSYYTIFSLAPLLVLVIAITGFVIGNNIAIRDQILNQIRGLVGNQVAQIVDTLITNTSQPRNGTIATVIGVVTLVVGATGLFGQLQDALNTIWKVKPRTQRAILRMITDRAQSFALVLGLAFLLLVSLVISAALSVINHYFTDLVGGSGITTTIINYAVSLLVITVIFGAIFKVLPDVNLSWRDVWVGALATAVLFIIGQFLISLYLGNAAASSVYGAAGSLVILLLWVYYSAQILFLGAEFTRVYAAHQGKEMTPTENAEAMTEVDRAREGLIGQPGDAARLQQALIPARGQPAIHPPVEEVEASKNQKRQVRYTSPDPNVVIPIIGAGLAAGIFTLSRVIRRIMK